jgi:hypothetical protein
MNVSKTATARFAAVVEAAGKPEVISLWTKPEQDKRFMAAVRQNRVLTIKQATVGSAKDFGVVGFLREKNSSYLIFPKSLDDFKSRRIVGIKYDLIQTPGPLGRVIRPETAEKAKRNRNIQPAEWEPRAAMPTGETHAAKHKKRFKVNIRFAATSEVVEEVEADSIAEAKEAAVNRADLPDFRRGTITRKVVKVRASD